MGGLGELGPHSAGAHTGKVGLIREQKFSCIFEIPPGEPGQLPAVRSPGMGWEPCNSTSNQKATGEKYAILEKRKQVKKKSVLLRIVVECVYKHNARTQTNDSD